MDPHSNRRQLLSSFPVARPDRFQGPFKHATSLLLHHFACFVNLVSKNSQTAMFEIRWIRSYHSGSDCQYWRSLGS